MKRLHPISTQRAWVLTLSMTIYLVGCNNQQMAASNPFMSPDRVPPPPTRTIAPGQAAPYYPGDPMPSAQAVPSGTPAVAQTTPPITPIGTTMPSPVATPQLAPQQAAAIPTSTAPTPATPQPLAFSNERNVAIPTDNEQLRFAVPPPQAAPQPIAAQAAPTAATNPLPAAAPVPAPAPASQVVPAAFNQPVPPPTTNPDSNGPWRSPQIAGGNSNVSQAQYIQSQPGQPTVLAAPQTQPIAKAPTTMPIEMRAVPSPQSTPMQVVPQPQQMVPQQYTPPPRMRFPSWTDPTTWFSSTPPQSQPQPGQQLIGYMVPGPNGQMQMVPLDQFHQMQTAGTGAAQQASGASSDGFRPRTTTK